MAHDDVMIETPLGNLLQVQQLMQPRSWRDREFSSPTDIPSSTHSRIGDVLKTVLIISTHPCYIYSSSSLYLLIILVISIINLYIYIRFISTPTQTTRTNKHSTMLYLCHHERKQTYFGLICRSTLRWLKMRDCKCVKIFCVAVMLFWLKKPDWFLSYPSLTFRHW